MATPYLIECGDIMKRLFALLCAVFLLTTSVMAYNGDAYVYVTRTGECYHRDGCSYLKSRIEITLQEAVDRGYRACSRCSPPRLGSGSASDDDHYRSGSSIYSTYSAPSYTYTPPTPRPTPKPMPTPTMRPLPSMAPITPVSTNSSDDYKALAPEPKPHRMPLFSKDTPLGTRIALFALAGFGAFCFVGKVFGFVKVE